MPASRAVRMDLVEMAMRRNATAVAKSTPKAIGNNETRSGEFFRERRCSSVIFHVAHALFMDTGILHLTADPAMTINRSARILLLRVKPNA